MMARRPLTLPPAGRWVIIPDQRTPTFLAQGSRKDQVGLMQIISPDLLAATHGVWIASHHLAQGAGRSLPE